MKNKTFIKYISLLVIFFVFSIVSYAEESKTKCEESGGTWVIPVSDEREGEKRQEFCRCPQGYELINNLCVKIEDEILCTASDGTWINNSCVCPEGSVGWKDNFGCDYVFAAEEADEYKTTHIMLLSIAIIILLIIIFSLLIKLLRSKKKKK